MQIKLSAISFAVIGLITACGGGGSPQGSASSSVSVSGAAVKGPIANANVCFYELLTTGKGAQLACTNTSADGSYSLNLSYAGGVFMEATGGTYTDETTGLNTTLTTPLTSVGTIAGNGSVVVATPLTTLAVNQVMGNLTTVSFNTAAANIGTTFGVTGSISTTIPNVTIGSNSSYGAALVGISKMMTGGANLSSIVNSGNVTQLQQNHNLIQQCVIAAEPGNVSSTPLMAGIFYTTAASPSASALRSERLRFAPAALPASDTSYTNVTGVSNGTLSFSNGTTQALNCNDSSNISITGQNLFLSGFICPATFTGLLNITGSSTNSSAGIIINPNTPFYLYTNANFNGNVSGLENVKDILHNPRQSGSRLINLV